MICRVYRTSGTSKGIDQFLSILHTTYIIVYTYIYYSQYHTNYNQATNTFLLSFLIVYMKMTFFQGGIIGSGCHIFTYINCMSLLDNVPNSIVGCIIQKRLTYIPPRSNLNPPIQHMSNSVPHKTFFDVILTSRYFYDISSFSYVRIALKKF